MNERIPICPVCDEPLGDQKTTNVTGLNPGQYHTLCYSFPYRTLRQRLHRQDFLEQGQDSARVGRLKSGADSDLGLVEVSQSAGEQPLPDPSTVVQALANSSLFTCAMCDLRFANWSMHAYKGEQLCKECCIVRKQSLCDQCEGAIRTWAAESRGESCKGCLKCKNCHGAITSTEFDLCGDLYCEKCIVGVPDTKKLEQAGTGN